MARARRPKPPPPPAQSDPISAARAWVHTHLQHGVACPACDQFCKQYKRPLNSTMALGLILIHRHFRDFPTTAWVHVPELLALAAPKVRGRKPAKFAGGDVAKLRYWGLIEAKNALRADGSDRNGFYRITPLGKDFVKGNVTVPRHAFTYNDVFLGLSVDHTSIQEALADNFDYTALMKK